jgi:putative hydrolase of the HAD superfamily
MAIRNIILDLGGVLLDIDYDKTTTAFEKLGFANFKRMYSQYSADQLFEKLETGMVSEDEFYFILREINNVSEKGITDAWNAMLLNFRTKSFEFINSLRPQYKIYLLSNTNAIHKAAFDRIFMETQGKPMDSFFDKAYYSHLAGFRKPNENIFEFLCDDAKLSKEESLFIDDSINNIETAAKLGFKTHLLKKDETIEKILPDYLTSS